MLKNLPQGQPKARGKESNGLSYCTLRCYTVVFLSVDFKLLSSSQLFPTFLAVI